MIEPELAFADIHDDMNVAEVQGIQSERASYSCSSVYCQDYLKYCVRYVMENHKQA